MGLIAANIAVFIVTLAPNGLGDDLVLHFGNGLHPTQWLTAAFMHIDIFHIVGNMMFLWPFGLVVEGKIGWWRFLLVYLGIAVTANFIFQVAMLGSTFQYALGASTAIYGLIGVSIIWAPKNELDVVYFVWVMFVLRTGTTEIAIMFFAALLHRPRFHRSDT
ncbi:MAG: rhomboid family intramembrane serine protease [Pirellulales bacterium]